MIDIDKLKKKPKTDEYIGARVSEELKEALERYCEENGVKSVSALLTALITAFLESKGYWNANPKD